MPKNPILTIGIVAHVDAGKTSLTECLLHQAGATTARGSVDKGSAITDGLAMEKSRGISIKTAAVRLNWKGNLIQLVDTPGHVDFSAEVDRSLSILDQVILVVSAKEGIQAHTLNLWESLKERKIPVLVFVNKVDRAGVDLEQVFMDLEKDLGAKVFALNYADVSVPDNPKLLAFSELKEQLSSKIIDKSFENIAELNESFLETYLEGQTVDLEHTLGLVKDQIRAQQLTGVLFGSAKLDLGVTEVLDGVVDLIATRKKPLDEPSAKVFKIEHHEKEGRLTYVKSYGSALQCKDVIYSQQLERDIKINQLFKPDLGGLEQVKELTCGEIGMMTTTEALQAGDVLGHVEFKDDFKLIHESVLGVEIKPAEDKDYQKLGEALELLNMEDPSLNFEWFKEEREFHLKILGPIQTEVLKETLHYRWGITAEFLKPKVIYKETPTKAAEGYVRYWMPKPCWAIMTFLLEPAPLGSGVKFESKVRTTDISNKYLNEVKRAIPWSLKQGIKGYEVTDLTITLTEGSEHTMHSNSGDFLLATPMGVMRGLENAGTDLLEPLYAFEIKAHQDLLGPVSSDLNQMRAQIEAPLFDGEFFTLSGKVAVAEAMDYQIKFNATTSGKGRLKLTLDGYQKTETTDEKIRAYKGVSPLNEAQWILHKRGAFKADGG